MPGLEPFISEAQHRNRFLYHYFFPYLWKWRTADVFIENFDRLIHNEMRYDILAYFDKEEHPPEYYRIIAQNPSRLHDFVYGLEVSDRIRLDLIGIAAGSEFTCASLKAFLQKVSERLQEVYRRNTALIEASAAHMQKELEPSGEFFLMKTKEFREGYDRNRYETAYTTMSFIYPIIVYFKKIDSDVYIYLGAENKTQQVYEIGSMNKYSLFFQSLSDESRTRIIELLRDKEMFIGEISSTLGIPLTTLSYHIRMLNAANIINIRSEGKKTYCSFSADEFKSAVFALDSISKI